MNQFDATEVEKKSLIEHFKHHTVSHNEVAKVLGQAKTTELNETL